MLRCYTSLQRNLSKCCPNAVKAAHFSGQVKAAPPVPPTPAPAPANIITVTVDGKEILCDKNMTVLQACEEAGAEIPRFCYHPRLSIAGNCRMCLVEVVKSPKPVASCAMPLMPGMIIKTNTPLVKKAREGVMEFLLINHPLDCPICDQGGECDLQDLSMDYGSDRGRYREWKRTVEDKYIGPFVKTVMTRCIHCTRCVRFAEEVAGVPDLGATGRGNTVEIGTYFEKPFDSELSGNSIDLCPVGALTSKPFAFAARPWELQKTDTIDVHDALGAAIRVDARGSKVLRVLPTVNEDVNEEWISDRSRFAYDGLHLQRLDTPLIRQSDGSLAVSSWQDAFSAIKSALEPVDARTQMRVLAGDLVPAEALMCMKDWANSLGCNNIDCRTSNDQTVADLRSSYVFNSGITGIEDADFILFIGTNLRMEAPVLNARIRRCQEETGSLKLASIGPVYKDVTKGCQQLGDDADILNQIANGKHPLSKEMAKAKRPMVIIGQSIMRRPDLAMFQSAISKLSTSVAMNLVTADWNGINVLQLDAARTAALDIGFVPTGPKPSNPPKFLYLLGADSFAESEAPSKSTFVVYQGSHGDLGASCANVILPSTAYTESSGIFVNTEGRPQMTTRATTPIGIARDDWQIIRALSEAVGKGKPLPYDSVQDVRQRLIDLCPHFEHLGKVESPIGFSAWNASPLPSFAIKSGKIAPAITNFFTTNVIARASKNLARAQAELKNSTNSYIE